jgi:hypothetical protein
MVKSKYRHLQTSALMLSKDSILRRIPAAIEPKQALFIDGIRHAVEIIDLAYLRLSGTLTQIALEPPTSTDLSKVVPAAFLDAWAIVDAVDRFRMLYQQMPGITFSPPEAGVQTLKEVTQPFRDLRNVADHLAQRAEFVVAKGGAALGVLSWVTGFHIDPPMLWLCTLRPGTLRTTPEFRQEPIVTTVDWPTDRIYLIAGGYEGNLSAIRPHIERRVRHFEVQLQNAFEKLRVIDDPAASDVFLRQAYQLDTGKQ